MCPRCGNRDEKYLGIRNGHIYCRLCIGFKGQSATGGGLFAGEIVPMIDYPLSREQEEISKKICGFYEEGFNTLVHAVCGAGKTELVFSVIAKSLSRGERVGFAIPRRDVVIELAKRLSQTFPKSRVVSVYGSHHNVIEGDLIVLTTHQLFRYDDYFDLLVLDEIDAFPFKGNIVLQSFFERSVKGHYVMMSATPSSEIIERFSKPGYKIVELFTRYHGHILPEPEIVIRIGISKYVYLVSILRRFEKEKKPCLVFAPTIGQSEDIFRYIRPFCKGGNCVHSKKADRADIIEDFRQNKYRYLVTTAVLERGVTIRNLQVIIFGSDHILYDNHALVQISGRVGRKSDAPEGKVIFLADKSSRAMEEAVEDIRFANLHM